MCFGCASTLTTRTKVDSTEKRDSDRCPNRIIKGGRCVNDHDSQLLVFQSTRLGSRSVVTTPSFFQTVVLGGAHHQLSSPSPSRALYPNVSKPRLPCVRFRRLLLEFGTTQPYRLYIVRFFSSCKPSVTTFPTVISPTMAERRSTSNFSSILALMRAGSAGRDVCNYWGHT